MAAKTLLTPIGVLICLVLFQGSAAAQERLTWEVESRCIDQTKVVMADPPPGKPARPPALRVDVVLPEGYDGVRRFPVLYLLQGAAGAWDYWLDYSDGELAKAIRGLDAIVVIPEGGTLGAWSNYYNRGRRTPCWEHHVLDELVPLVEQRLKVRPGRRWHAVGGFSGGALGTLNFAAKKPGYFGQALSFSGPIDWEDPAWKTEVEAYALFIGGMGARWLENPEVPFPLRHAFGHPIAQDYYWAGHNPVRLAPALRHTRVYVAHGGPAAPRCFELLAKDRCVLQDTVIGTYHEGVRFAANARSFIKAARAAGADVTYQPSTGGHWYSYSARFLADAIWNWGLFEPVAKNPTDWTYKTVSQTGNMWGLRFEFTSPRQTVETFTRAGDRFSGSGSGTVRVFRSRTRCELTVTLPFTRVLPDQCLR
jgi:S-formylglutathione hydrolase FrmB